MIVVRLTGGLGNQLFQYAFARNLAIKHGAQLKFDVSSYRLQSPNITARRYELDQFKIQAELARLSETWYLGRGGRMRDLASLLASKLLPSRLLYVKEKSFSFCPEMLQLPDNVYLDGYWQSERYFEENAELIRKDLQITASPMNVDKEIENEIEGGGAIAIHVRRGDFVSDSTIAATHGVCGLDYYRRAIAYVTDRVENAKLFIFSDDPSWVKQNLRTEVPTVYVDHNTEGTAIQDFRLMSLCDHQIIANSSFSWWAAWLNANPAKIVIAPARWFTLDAFDTKDLMPEGWIKL